MRAALCGSCVLDTVHAHTPVTVTEARDGNGSTVPSSAVRMQSLEAVGTAARSRAAAPLTNGAAMEVPLMVT